MAKIKKKSAGRKVTELEILRAGSAYQGARGFLGMPCLIAGAVFCGLGGVAGMMVLPGFADAGLLALPMLLPAIMLVICGLFFFGVVAAGNAFFDMADCALRAETRDKAREAKEAYEAYRNQGPDGN